MKDLKDGLSQEQRALALKLFDLDKQIKKQKGICSHCSSDWSDMDDEDLPSGKSRQELEAKGRKEWIKLINLENEANSLVRVLEKLKGEKDDRKFDNP